MSEHSSNVTGVANKVGGVDLKAVVGSLRQQWADERKAIEDRFDQFVEGIIAHVEQVVDVSTVAEEQAVVSDAGSSDGGEGSGGLEMPKRASSPDVSARVRKAVSFGSVSSGSWADENEEAVVEKETVSSSSVSSGADARLFGVLAPTQVSVVEGGEVGFVARYVRTPQAAGLKSWLISKGVHVASRYKYELALVTYAAGAMPAGFERGKQKLNMLAGYGDAMLKAQAFKHGYFAGRAPEEVSNEVNRSQSDASLSAICVNSGLSNHLLAPSGIDLRTAKTSATMLEAVVGMVALRVGEDAVARLMVVFGLLELGG